MKDFENIVFMHFEPLTLSFYSCILINSAKKMEENKKYEQ